MKKTFSLKAQQRTKKGHNVKHVRTGGGIPATVYGAGLQSVSLVIPKEEFDILHKQTGETNLINLSWDHVTHPVLIHEVQKHPVHQTVLHVTFLKVNLKEKMKTNVPVEIVGESPGVAEGKGVLLTLVQEIEIEALPSDIPEKVVVDVSLLTDVNMDVKVGQLAVPAGATLVTDAETVVVKLSAPVVEKEEPVATPEAEAGQGEVKEGEKVESEEKSGEKAEEKASGEEKTE